MSESYVAMEHKVFAVLLVQKDITLIAGNFF
jgi:hypothetical protein